MPNLLDGAGDFAEGAYDTVAGVADDAAGSTDEAFAGQFDDEAGGGFGEGFGQEFSGDDPSFLVRGVQGWSSLLDNDPGNVAGPGDSSWEAAENAAEHGFVGGALMTGETRNLILLVASILIGGVFVKEFSSGLGEGVAS
jgi:hypothetical protein